MIDQYPSQNGVLTSLIWRKTAAGGETSLSGYDNANQALSYTPGQEQVYLNGILLVRGDDYTATNGTSITGLAALAANDFVQINCYNNFSVASVPATSITGEVTNSQITSLAASKLTGTIANNQLANSSITINGSAVSLGGSTTIAGGSAQDDAPTSPTEGQLWLDTNGTLATTAFVEKSTISAKGDLYVGTANDTVGILSTTENGATLVADSSATTGLRWNPSYQAGKNFIINGGFDIWQRGTSFSTTNGGNGYHADRWTYYGGGTGTITRSTALLRDGAQFALRFTSTSAAGNADIYQLIETLNTVQLQGKTVTVSVYVAGTAGKTAQVLLGSSTTDDDGLFGSYTTLTPSGTSSVTTTGSYQRITAQFTIPSNARTLRLGLNHGALANTEFMSWAQVMLEVGSTATNFSRAGGNIAGELAACQRYLPCFTGDGELASGQAYTTTSGLIVFRFPVQTRVVPTGVTISAAGDFRVRNAAASFITCTAVNFVNGNTTTGTVDGIVASGLVAGNATSLYGTSSSSRIFFTGCEL